MTASGLMFRAFAMPRASSSTACGESAPSDSMIDAASSARMSVPKRPIATSEMLTSDTTMSLSIGGFLCLGSPRHGAKEDPLAPAVEAVRRGSSGPDSALHGVTGQVTLGAVREGVHGGSGLALESERREILREHHEARDPRRILRVQELLGHVFGDRGSRASRVSGEVTHALPNDVRLGFVRTAGDGLHAVETIEEIRFAELCEGCGHGPKRTPSRGYLSSGRTPGAVFPLLPLRSPPVLGVQDRQGELAGLPKGERLGVVIVLGANVELAGRSHDQKAGSADNESTVTRVQRSSEGNAAAS